MSRILEKMHEYPRTLAFVTLVVVADFLVSLGLYFQ